MVAGPEPVVLKAEPKLQLVDLTLGQHVGEDELDVPVIPLDL